MSGIFGSLFGGGKRKASQPADASGRAAAMSSRTGPGPSSWTGPPPRDPKEWRGPHNPTRSRGTKTDADADASGPPRSVMDLTRDEAAVELERLAGLIAEADAAYYQEDAPLMTDAEYDAARQRNAAIEARFPDLKREDSPSDRVGAAAHEGFAKAAHAAPMLSLDNAFSDEDVSDFADRIRRFLGLSAEEEVAITAEPKIDGLSLSLTYEKGRLVRAATRVSQQTSFLRT